MVGNIGEEGEKGVIVLSGNGIDLVIMATGATNGHSQEYVAGGPKNVIQVVVPSQFAVGWLVVPNAKTMKSGCSNGVGVLVG